MDQISKIRSYDPGQILAMDTEDTVGSQISIGFLGRVWFQEGKKG
jgi:hypothetical protein